MANRSEVLSTKNTSPETPMQFAACRNVGRPIVAAAAFPGGWTRWKAGPRAGLPAPQSDQNRIFHRPASKRCGVIFSMSTIDDK